MKDYICIFVIFVCFVIAAFFETPEPAIYVPSLMPASVGAAFAGFGW